NHAAGSDRLAAPGHQPGAVVRLPGLRGLSAGGWLGAVGCAAMGVFRGFADVPGVGFLPASDRCGAPEECAVPVPGISCGVWLFDSVEGTRSISAPGARRTAASDT